MTPQSNKKDKKNSSKVNLTISVVFHVLLAVALIVLAAKSGLIGPKKKPLEVVAVHENKPPPPQKKPDQPKEEPKPQAQTAPKEEPKEEPPPQAAPITAPPPAQTPDFSFDEGAKMVNTDTNPVTQYKSYIEYTIRNRWDRPDDMDDANFKVEVSVNVDKHGYISNVQWLNGSGNKIWDQSVRDVMKQVTQIDRPPPTNFPPNITIRFDTEEETQPVFQ